MAVFLTPNTKFKPFSYQEMLAPVLAYKEAYDTLETEMSNLDILAGSIESKLNPKDAEDQKTLKKYQSFQKDMESAMNDFYKSGYSTDVKRRLNTLKTQYAKELDPINQAYERRLEDAKFIRQNKISNPNLIVEGIGESTSAYMNGNTPNPTVVNLNTVSEAAKNASTGLSKQFIDQIGLQGVEGYIGEYLMYGVQKGITSDMVSEFTKYVDAIKNDRTGQFQTPQGKALYNMFEQIRTANNYDKLSQAGKDRLDASIIQGLVSGAAADESINYTADRHWDIEAQKENINYIKAKIEKTRNGGFGTGTPPAQLGTDLRTTTVNYTGKNFDINDVVNTISYQFEQPVPYNGTTLYNSIQAYNEIHKEDAKIAELETAMNKYGNGWKVVNPYAQDHTIPFQYNSDGSIKMHIVKDGKINEDLSDIYSELTVLYNNRTKRENELKDITFKDKELDRFREYTTNRANEAVKTLKAQFGDPSVYIADSKGNPISLDSADSNSIVYVKGEQSKELTNLIPFYNLVKKYTSTPSGQITPEELEVYATLAASDLSTGNVAEKRILIFDDANSKSGLSDAITTLTRNINSAIANGNKIDIVDVDNKPVKSKKIIKKLYKDGVLNPDKILGLELDFNSAATGRVRLNTTEGIFYISSAYLGDQANVFINGATGISRTYNDLMSNFTKSKTAKAYDLNTALHSAADAIQEQFSLNRDQEQSYTISNTDLNKIIQYLAEEE